MSSRSPAQDSKNPGVPGIFQGMAEGPWSVHPEAGLWYESQGDGV